MKIQFLKNTKFSSLHQAFLQAFSDYVVPMQPTQQQLDEMFVRRGVDLAISAGAFEKRSLVGFTMNAMDVYQEVLTVYDSGSGVHPDYRRRGIADAIFRFALPKLRESGAKQYLLEVFEKNIPAIRLYEKTGFHISRKFGAFRGVVSSNRHPGSIFEIREVTPDWNYWASQWDWEPSWQNSTHSVQRSKYHKVILGIFSGDRCIGYGVVYPASGDIPQFCIHREFREKGAGTKLIHALQNAAGPGKELRAINMESSAESTIRFLQNQGFETFGTQLEMRMNL